MLENIIINAKRLLKVRKRRLKLVSGGTDNHLLLVDVQTLGLTGKVAEKVLDEIGITVNKNTIPYDPQSPFVTSGSPHRYGGSYKPWLRCGGNGRNCFNYRVYLEKSRR